MWYVYVLKSLQYDQWYTGITNDLKRRVTEHNNGKSTYTKYRGPYKLLYYEASYDEKDTRAREKYLKSGVGKRYLKNRMKNLLGR